MREIKGFKATCSHRLPTIAVVEEGGRERLLQPPDGVRFEWGHMGGTVTHLAAAIAEELFGADAPAHAAELIKRHFLTAFRRQDPWELDAQEVVEYVRARTLTPGNRLGVLAAASS